VKKALKIILKVVASIVIILVLFFSTIAVIYSSVEYSGRMAVTLVNHTGVKDYAKFPYREIKMPPQSLISTKISTRTWSIHYSVKAGYSSGGKPMPIADLDTFLKKNDTTSFIVIKG